MASPIKKLQDRFFGLPRDLRLTAVNYLTCWVDLEYFLESSRKHFLGNSREDYPDQVNDLKNGVLRLDRQHKLRFSLEQVLCFPNLEHCLIPVIVKTKEDLSRLLPLNRLGNLTIVMEDYLDQYEKSLKRFLTNLGPDRSSTIQLRVEFPYDPCRDRIEPVAETPDYIKDFLDENHLLSFQWNGATGEFIDGVLRMGGFRVIEDRPIKRLDISVNRSHSVRWLKFLTELTSLVFPSFKYDNSEGGEVTTPAWSLLHELILLPTVTDLYVRPMPPKDGLWTPLFSYSGNLTHAFVTLLTKVGQVNNLRRLHFPILGDNVPFVLKALPNLSRMEVIVDRNCDLTELEQLSLRNIDHVVHTRIPVEPALGREIITYD